MAALWNKKEETFREFDDDRLLPKVVGRFFAMPAAPFSGQNSRQLARGPNE